MLIIAAPAVFLIAVMIAALLGLVPLIGIFSPLLYPIICAGYMSVLGEVRRWYASVYVIVGIPAALYLSNAAAYVPYYFSHCRHSQAPCASVWTVTRQAAEYKYYGKYTDKAKFNKEFGETAGDLIGEGDVNNVIDFIMYIIPTLLQKLMVYLLPFAGAMVIGVLIDSIMAFLWGGITIAIFETWL